MRILVAEDDLALRHGLQEVLTAAGHQAIVTSDGEHADILLVTEPFDLLILDLGLPRMDGLTVLKRLRQRGQSMPVLILTARDRTEQRVHGLDAGADDYMSKPFDLSELEARVRALLRRGQGTRVQLGKLEWSQDQRQAWIENSELSLSRHELTVLEALLQSSGRIVGKDMLAHKIGNDRAQAGENMVEVYIHRLRQKLVSANVEVKTVRGLGYLLREMRHDE